MSKKANIYTRKMALPNARTIALGALSDDEFNALMNRAFQQYADGKCSPVNEVEARFVKELNI